MKDIEYNYEKNSIIIKKKLFKNMTLVEDSSTQIKKTNFSISSKTDYIEIKNCFSRNEKIGRQGELKFKNLLEKSGIPFLYISQSPVGIDKSSVLLENVMSKRPDFLINSGPGYGSMLLDVKCLRKIGFDLSNTKEYFYLTCDDISKLSNLEKTTNLPVWVAFTDNSLLKKKDSIFYLVPISLIENHLELIRKNLDEDELTFVRIPNEFLTECHNEIKFVDRGYIKIESEISQKYENAQRDNKSQILRNYKEIKAEFPNASLKNIISFFNKKIGSNCFIDFEVTTILYEHLKE